MREGYRNIFTAPRLYVFLSIIVLVFVAGYLVDFMFLPGIVSLLFLILTLFMDIFLLYSTGKRFLITRELPDRFSNGDDNEVKVFIKNNYFFTINIEVIDEIPFLFQLRNFSMHVRIKGLEEEILRYDLKPVERGVYEFGMVYAFVASPVGLIQRRFSGDQPTAKVKVYPSFLRMHKYQLLAISDRLNEVGITRVRKIGHHTEFDQIREYVNGDDYRTINWKATARKDKLMVNQYQDERAQEIYSIIDMGRVMKLPFVNMTLLDHAINAALIISNTALMKHDKAGLMTFNTTVNSFLPAERRNNTLTKILELLYDQKTQFAESNFELVYATIKRRIAHRSLLIIYSNFESFESMLRQLGYLTKLSRVHLVLFVMFENTEIQQLAESEVHSLEDIYITTIAEKFLYEKKRMCKELAFHGVYSLLTKPQNLTVNLINKYLELKDRGLI